MEKLRMEVNRRTLKVEVVESVFLFGGHLGFGFGGFVGLPSKVE